ncbi:putative quinol monooxygenase [Sphingomonas phyllosphaerae]|uniref:putative quinol monooxygenase n=1 Tax=Sphingomonas phyllosphaerae TaxID=257003 RepID=UPI002412F62D|nr:antibiotic biosynthesis monooxygenase [Sphingomonas phyllosphaerae]
MSVLFLASTALAASTAAGPAPEPAPMVRIAELEIDPAQLDAYKRLLAEEQEASVRLEPGVLMLHSVALVERPTSVRLLEVYASRAAYEAHIRSPHFLSYKSATERMVRSLRLIQTQPILLCAKSKGAAGGPVTCL